MKDPIEVRLKERIYRLYKQYKSTVDEAKKRNLPMSLEIGKNFGRWRESRYMLNLYRGMRNETQGTDTSGDAS